METAEELLKHGDAILDAIGDPPKNLLRKLRRIERLREIVTDWIRDGDYKGIYMTAHGMKRLDQLAQMQNDLLEFYAKEHAIEFGTWKDGKGHMSLNRQLINEQQYTEWKEQLTDNK